MTKRSTLLLYIITAALVAGTVIVLEYAVRRSHAATDVPMGGGRLLLKELPHATISGREIGSQMLVHNVALFAAHPDPASVDAAFVGTSRTKVLRPGWMGLKHAVNASGNSYNEISYGLLLQAEVARLQFPNLRRVYLESSMLLRRPARLILEPDHRKYLPLLESLAPLRDQLPGAQKFREELARTRTEQTKPGWHLQLLAHRSDMRLSRLLPTGMAAPDGPIPVNQDILFRQLDANGQRKEDPPVLVPRDKQRPEILAENVKVQRLRDVADWAPWDGLFDLAAIWGRTHGIEIVLFQPPVRSDLYRRKIDMGLPAHVADLERVARQYGIPFIDLNRPELGYIDDWTLFSDEDHLETCIGVVLLQSALDVGYQQFKREGVLLPRPARAEIQRRSAQHLARCAGSANGS